jgi:hypothetical protein
MKYDYDCTETGTPRPDWKAENLNTIIIKIA